MLAEQQKYCSEEISWKYFSKWCWTLHSTATLFFDVVRIIGGGGGDFFNFLVGHHLTSCVNAAAATDAIFYFDKQKF